MKIELWDNNQVGIIFPYKTEIIWTNQCGGTSCDHPELEGVFIPMNQGMEDGLDWWLDSWGMDYIQYCIGVKGLKRSYDFIAKLTKREFVSFLNQFSYFTLPNNNKIFYEIGEAWIPVKIVKSPYLEKHLENFVGKIGIFTYPNSD